MVPANRTTLLPKPELRRFEREAEMEEDVFAAITANDKGRIAQLMAAGPGAAHARNAGGISALMQARYENRMEIVDLLRKAAGDLDIFESSALGDVARLKKLLANDGELVKARSADGFTPLHLACFFGQLEAAEILVQHGADANAVSPSRIAVIHSAAASRNAALLKLVLRAGADPTRNNSVATPRCTRRPCTTVWSGRRRCWIRAPIWPSRAMRARLRPIWQRKMAAGKWSSC
ncbi:MAG: ankyrin repeat domain-containing protein [Candidatus Korobacteraceae bacterium]